MLSMNSKLGDMVHGVGPRAVLYGLRSRPAHTVHMLRLVALHRHHKIASGIEVCPNEKRMQKEVASVIENYIV